MKRFLALVAVIAATSVSAAGTYAELGKVYKFTTVDAFERVGNAIRITGIVADDPAPSELTFSSYSSTTVVKTDETCERAAMLAMAKPGQYVVTAQQVSSSGMSCKLSRAVP